MGGGGGGVGLRGVRLRVGRGRLRRWQCGPGGGEGCGDGPRLAPFRLGRARGVAGFGRLESPARVVQGRFIFLEHK